MARAVDAHAGRTPPPRGTSRAAFRSETGRTPPFEDIPADSGRDGDIIGEGGGGVDAAPLPPPVNYVGFPTGTTLTHRRHVSESTRSGSNRSRFPSRATATVTGRRARAGGGCSAPEGLFGAFFLLLSSSLELLPWCSSTTACVARTAWYLSNVFGRERYCSLPRGGFVEDTLGQRMLSGIRGPRGLAAPGLRRVPRAVRRRRDAVRPHRRARPRDGGRGGRRDSAFAERHTSEEAWGSDGGTGTGGGLAAGGEGDPGGRAGEGLRGGGGVLEGVPRSPGTSAFSNEGGREAEILSSSEVGGE